MSADKKKAQREIEEQRLKQKAIDEEKFLAERELNWRTIAEQTDSAVSAVQDKVRNTESRLK